MTIVVTLLAVISAVGLPKTAGALANYRFRAGLNDLGAELNMAKLAAVANATDYQVAFSGTAAYELNVKSGGSFGLAANNEALALPSGLSYGYGSVAVAAGDSGEQTAVTTAPAQATAITFNSLGLPVDSAGNPLAQNAIYLTDGSQVGAVTVSLAGRVQRWYWLGSGWVEE